MKEWVTCNWQEAEQYRSRILCGGIGLEGKWSKWQDGQGLLGRAGLEVVYRKTKKNTYLVTAEWSRYEFFCIFEGKDENDPDMRANILDWVSGLGDGAVSDDFLSLDKQSSYIDLKCYLVEKVDMGDLVGDTWELVQEQEKAFKKRQQELKEQQIESNERKELARLKEKYEKDV